MEYDEAGLKTLSFIAQGDMRVAINGLQSTVAGEMIHNISLGIISQNKNEFIEEQLKSKGFDKVTRANVYEVCDTPNPMIVNQAIECVIKKKPSLAYTKLSGLVKKGYAIEHVLAVLQRCTLFVFSVFFQIS